MNIVWSANASADLEAIVDYISRDSPRAAIRMDGLLVSAAASLAMFSQEGRQGAVEGTREILPHPSYRLVYEVAGDTVFVLTIVHTARMWPPAIEDRD